MNFKIGDRVRLVSGGPKMAVEDVGDYTPMGPVNGVKCVWFSMEKGVEKAQDRVFDAATLEIY